MRWVRTLFITIFGLLCVPISSQNALAVTGTAVKRVLILHSLGGDFADAKIAIDWRSYET